MATKVFSPSKTQTAQIALTSTEMQQLHGLISNTREVMLQHTTQSAFNDGMPIQKALRADGKNVRIMLLGELERLVRAVGATRTFQTQEDLQHAIDDVVEMYPSLKLEEILVAFKQIRQGKFELYSTFTTTSLLKCLGQYEMQNTVPLREQQHKIKKQNIETGAIDVQRLIKDLRRDGKLQTPKKILDRFVPVPNDCTTYEEIEKWRAQHWPQSTKDEAQEIDPTDSH